MAYGFKSANPSALFLANTTAVTVQTITWYSDQTAVYCLEFGGKLACPTSVGGTCNISLVFNGVNISQATAMQSMTNCYTEFGTGQFQSDCTNQDATTGLNTLSIVAQLNSLATGQAAKIRETFTKFTQTG